MAALRIILPAAAIALTLALFLQLAWPARGAIARRTARRGGIGIAVLTAVYAVAAFTGLGSARDPQRFCTLEAGESATLALDGVHSIGTVWYYTGLYTGEYTLAYSTDGVTFTPAGTMPQGYADLFKWLQPEMADTAPAAAAYVRITASAHMELGELALYDPQGSRIGVRAITGPASADALCDEADTVPAASTYYNSTYFDEIYHARTADSPASNEQNCCGSRAEPRLKNAATAYTAVSAAMPSPPRRPVCRGIGPRAGKTRCASSASVSVMAAASRMYRSAAMRCPSLRRNAGWSIL